MNRFQKFDRRKEVICAAAVVLILVSACTACSFQRMGNKAEGIKEVKAVEEEDGIFFDFSIDEYIAGYDLCCRDELGNDYLSASDGSSYYLFSEDEGIVTLPELSLQASEDSGNVERITAGFDWHSYSDTLMKKYDRMCFYALKTILSDFTDDEICSLYEKVSESGYSHMRKEWFGRDALPYELFLCSDVGIFSYYAKGDRQYLCIVPVTEKKKKELKEKGVKITQLEI